MIEFLRSAPNWDTGGQIGRLIVQHAAFLSLETLGADRGAYGAQRSTRRRLTGATRPTSASSGCLLDMGRRAPSVGGHPGRDAGSADGGVAPCGQQRWWNLDAVTVVSAVTGSDVVAIDFGQFGLLGWPVRVSTAIP